MNIHHSVKKLINYAISKELIDERDSYYITNLILDVLLLDDYVDENISCDKYEISDILDEINDYAVSKGLIEDTLLNRDLFDTKIMGILTPRPSQVYCKFKKLYDVSPKNATNFFYDFSINTNYIRKDRIVKDKKWIYKSKYGDLDITINLSKPEKDPKDIAKQKDVVSSSYPKCMLCIENEGFKGNLLKPSRFNHRVIPVSLDGENWYMQYSPYVYYNEHSIVFNSQHTPMKIDKSCFKKLFEFVDKFNHYFIGSNADLPIVGGSILSHEHFQGGNYVFAMQKASNIKNITFNGFEDVKASILNWPLSTIRLSHKDYDRLIILSDKILNKWRNYTDEDAFVFAYTNLTPHNTITPIVRKNNDEFEIDLVLRNNITTNEHPLGVYHPHKELHNIKKENIGLIEVMGLAVLPSRLNYEMDVLKDAILNSKEISEIESISKHTDWVKSFINDYDITKENIDTIIEEEIGKTFLRVLEDCGVFKMNDEGLNYFMNFIKNVNN